MRLVTFVWNGEARLGALASGKYGQRVFDLNRLDRRLPADMIAFLQGGGVVRELAGRTLSTATAEQGLDLASVTLKAPIPRPGKIVAIGRNYLEHAKEGGADASPYPIIFAKYANAVIGHGEAIVLPQVSNAVDYEGELGVVIGRRAKVVQEAQACDYIGGYLPFNDVSARDYQMRTSQWTAGKTFDTFAPMGPALVTVDEVPDPQRLRLRTIVSGEVLQEGNTADMIFSVAHLVAYVSTIMTLEPGDVIATGTPAGVGFARKPPRYLRPGDIVQVEIEGLGCLENPVVSE